MVFLFPITVAAFVEPEILAVLVLVGVVFFVVDWTGRLRLAARVGDELPAWPVAASADAAGSFLLNLSCVELCSAIFNHAFALQERFNSEVQINYSSRLNAVQGPGAAVHHHGTNHRQNRRQGLEGDGHSDARRRASDQI